MATATTSISDFKAALPYGGARPTLFDFTVTGAPSAAVVTANLGNMKLYCNVSAIPALTVTPIERIYFGRTVKIPGDMVFADLTTSFINTENYSVRNEIEKWMEFINKTVANKSQSAADFGTGTAKLKQYQKDGTETMIYQFNEIWPTTISEIALSYDTASDIEQFDVTWAYNYYTQALGTARPTGLSTHAIQR